MLQDCTHLAGLRPVPPAPGALLLRRWRAGAGLRARHGHLRRLLRGPRAHLASCTVPSGRGGFRAPLGWVAFVLMVGSMAIDGGTQFIGLRSSQNELQAHHRAAVGLRRGDAAGADAQRLRLAYLAQPAGARSAVAPRRVPCWPCPWSTRWCGGERHCWASDTRFWSALAILVTLTCVNMVMVCMTPWFERKAERLIDVWPAALVALALSFLEIWLAALLRLGLVALAGGIS